jgi:hypothetical protein
VISEDICTLHGVSHIMASVDNSRLCRQRIRRHRLRSRTEQLPHFLPTFPEVLHSAALVASSTLRRHTAVAHPLPFSYNPTLLHRFLQSRLVKSKYNILIHFLRNSLFYLLVAALPNGHRFSPNSCCHVDSIENIFFHLPFTDRCLAKTAVYFLERSNGSLLNEIMTCLPVVV